MPTPSVVHVVIDDSTSKVITGIYEFDRTNGGILKVPSYNGEPSSPVAGELYWDTSTNSLYRRNNTNTDWETVEALLATHALTHESGGDDEITHDNLVGAGTNSHTQIDSHISDATIHFTEASINIPASQISDFDTEVSNNTDVDANTSARHDAVTVTDSAEIDLTLTGQDLTASIIASSIDETKLDASVNASLDLADSAVQAGDLSTVATSGDHTDLSNIGTNTHAVIDSHIADGTIHFTEASISLTASQISDFDTEVSNNTDVAANTSARHAELHTVASHSDTIATGTQLNTLVGGGVTALHSHAASAPAAHATTHENGGSDEIDVAGLSGVLADPQTPASHTHVEADITDLTHYTSADFDTDFATKDTADLTEGTSLYYTEARVNANTNVAANTAARHTHTNKTLLDALTDAGPGTNYLSDDGTYKSITITTDFVSLTDTPAAYTGEAGKFVRVNATPDGLEFVTLDGVAISGDHTDLSNIGTNTHGQIDTHISDGTIHFTQGSISIPASQISDFDTEVSNNTDVAANTSARHSHSNKTLLDSLTDAGTGTNYLADDGTYKALTITTDFISLTDTPSTYTGTAGQFVRVNATPDGLEFVTLDNVATSGDHNDLSNIGSNSHSTIDSHISDGTVHFTQATINILASQISDFDTEVSNNTDVSANTSARHDALTVTDSSEINLALTGQDLTASIIASSIDETKLDASVNASLDLADSAIQSGDLATVATSGDHTDLSNIGTNTHAQVDSHIADGTIHFTEGSIDHTAISNIGTNSHSAIDTHIGDGTIHFTNSSVLHNDRSDLQGGALAEYYHLSLQEYNNVINGKAFTVIVAKTGGDFNTIQGAIDSITDASQFNPYIVLVHPGVYSENVVLKSGVNLKGAGTSSDVIISASSGTALTFGTGSSSVKDLSVLMNATATGSKSVACASGGIGYLDSCVIIHNAIGTYGTLIDISAGLIRANNITASYTNSVSGGGNHIGINIEENGGFTATNCRMHLVIASDDDIYGFKSNSNLALGEAVTDSVELGIEVTVSDYSSNTYGIIHTGTAQLIHFTTSHVSIKCTGGGTVTGIATHMTVTTGSATVRGTGNAIHVEDFDKNYFADIGTGCTFISHYDDANAGDGILGSGTLYRVGSTENGELRISESLKVGSVKDGNYLDVESDGTITLHGNARVLKHVHINAKLFGRGTSGIGTIVNTLCATLVDSENQWFKANIKLPDDIDLTVNPTLVISMFPRADMSSGSKVVLNVTDVRYLTAGQSIDKTPDETDLKNTITLNNSKRYGVQSVYTLDASKMSAGAGMSFRVIRMTDDVNDDRNGDLCVSMVTLIYTSAKLG